MKTIARIKFCEGFIKALKNTKDFPNLHTYCRHWTNNIETDDTILCEVVDDTDIKTGQPKKHWILSFLSLITSPMYVVRKKKEKEKISGLW